MSKIRRFSLAFTVCLVSMLWLFGLLGVESLFKAKAEKSPLALAVSAPLTATAPCGQEFVFNAGIEDDFDPSIGPELTQPSSHLQSYITPTAEFDDTMTNTVFAHTFVSLTSRFPGQPICAASLKIHLKAGSGGTTSDTLRLAFVNDSGLLDQWERYLGSGNPLTGLLNYNWTPGVSATIGLNLDQLPLAGGGITSTLPALNQYGFLDVLVEDNTAVDYVSLTVWYQRADTPGDLIEVGNRGFAAAGQLVGLGEASVLSATISTITPTLSITECVSASILGANEKLCLYDITSAHSVTSVLASIPLSDAYTFEPNYIIRADCEPDVVGSPGERPGITVTAGTSLKSQWAIDQVGGLPDDLPTGAGVEVGIFDTSCFSVPRNNSRSEPFMDTTMTVVHPLTETYASLPYASTIHANLCGHGEYAASLVRTIAPSATLSLYRVLDDTGRGDLFTLEKMLNTFISDTLAANQTLNQTVINLSLGVAAPLTPTTATTSTVETLQTLLDRAHTQGAVIVGAAGNHSSYEVISPTQQPAAHDFVIGVAASEQKGKRAFYSNPGQVAAPGGFGHCGDVVTHTDCLVGVDQTSTTGYRAWAGTSFATPLVSGLAALLLEQNSMYPIYPPNEVPGRIYEGSTPAPWDANLGDGIINVPCTVGHPSCNRPAAIHGMKWNDLNEDGVKDAGEPGLEGWEITLTNADGNILTTTTDTDGNYWFVMQPTGTYTVSEVQQNGWTQTFPTAPGTHTVTLQAGEVAKNIDFGNWQAELGQIHGMKWHDLNGNGVKDPNEPGLEGWEITLTDADGNILATTTSDANGNYSFTDLPPGTYTVSEVMQDGWTQTYPTAPGTHTVQLEAGQAVEAFDFGNWQAELGQIHGMKWHDLNGNGVKDPNEPGLEGWEITLTDADGNILATTTTDANGNYSFTDLPPGTYTVSEVMQDGWTQSFPTAPGTHTVQLEAGQAVEAFDFGNWQTELGQIHGMKWHDLNGNGVKDPNEPGLEGWEITLTDADGNILATTTSDANGNYSFTDLPPGTYTVSEVMQDGWTQTYPTAPGTHTVQLEAGQVVENIDFGNSSDDPGACDLSISKEHEGNTFFYGQSGMYNLVVSNNGDGTCEGPITITDTLPAGMSVPSGTFTIGSWSCTADARNPQTITCTDPGPLAATSSLPLISLTVNVPNISSAGGFGWNEDLAENCATVNGPNDSNDGNNESCDEVTVIPSIMAPDLSINKSHVGHFEHGGVGTYVINVTNVGSGPATGPITVIDNLPLGTTYLSGGGSAWSCTPSGPTVTCTYVGPPSLPLGAGQTLPPLVINISLSDHPELENCAEVTTPGDINSANDQSCDVVQPTEPINAPDLGDAPDSTNNSGDPMTTYSPMPAPANFPTVYDPSGYPSASVGPKHNSPQGDAWLGQGVSGEADADQLPDQDGITNINPSRNAADRDEYDDGVDLNTLRLPICGFTSFEYDANVVGGSGTRKLNVWFDYNQDGDFEDIVHCRMRVRRSWRTVTVPEWAVQNYPVNLSNGYHSNLRTPLFFAKRPRSSRFWQQTRLWMRVTLTGENDPQPCFGPGAFGPCLADGRGPIDGYEFGETEDYLVRSRLWPIRIEPDIQATLSFSQTNGLTDIVTVPSGAVSEPMTMTVNTVSGEPLLGSQLALRRFELNAGTEQESDLTFQKPAILTLHYSDEEVGGGGVRRSGPALDLRRYDSEQGEWVSAACGEVVDDSDANSLSVPVCQTGEFALAAPVTTGVIISAPVIGDGTAGEQVQLPITVDLYRSSEALDSYEFTLAYDPNVVEITGVSKNGTFSSQWTVTADTTVAGQIKVVANGAGALPDEGGTLINLTGQLISAGANSPLTFSDQQFNEGQTPAYSQPGFLATKNQLYLPILTK